MRYKLLRHNSGDAHRVLHTVQTATAPDPTTIRLLVAGRAKRKMNGLTCLRRRLRESRADSFRFLVFKRAFGICATWLMLLCLPSIIFAAPTLSRITPFYGQPGDVVTITGNGFAVDPGQDIVRFGPNRAAVLSANATQLVVQVPNGQPLGTTRLTVSLAGPQQAKVGISR